ncbi:MAG: hypothetical protein ACR2KV_14275 [Solirubrobacteraceae bacterium]
MPTQKKALTGLATATLVLGQALLAPAIGSSAVRLTKASVTALAKKDATAAAVISSGDKVVVTGCHAISRTTFRCQIEIIPAQSQSRCRWTDTIRLVKGKPVITYSHARCSD